MTSVVPASLHVCLRALLLLLMLTWCQGAVRNYYIASRDVWWNYCPGGVNLVNPRDQATANKYVVPGTNRVGSKRLKTLFFQYTDQTYTTEMVKPAYQGLLGPIIRGEVGDVIVVHFFNNASRNYSIHPHGVFYEKKSEGALYLDGTSGISKEDDSVMPGRRVTVTWNVTVSDAPAEGDPACLPWVYHSHINTRRDVSTGMIGVVVTCRTGTLNSKNERVDVDVEVPLFVMNWDENISWHHRDNINTFCLSPSTCQQLADSGDPNFVDSNLMRSVNGRSFGTLEGLEVCVGDRVQFYVIGFGNEMDIHSMHFHGQNLKYQHRRGDTVSVYSATFVAVETIPANPGRWLIADFVDDHQKEGISAFYNVRNCLNKVFKTDPTNSKNSGTTREFFLTAESTIWKYGPTGLDGRTGLPLTTADSPSNLYFERSQTRLGGVYKKAKFIQYTNSLFSTKVSSSPKDAHLGILGPVLRVEVGDRVVVTLKNLLPYPVSFLPHGLSYNVTEEDMVGYGVPGGSVGLNQVHTYRFDVPTNLLEGSSEPCLSFLYTSMHDPVRDHNTGLVGAILVCQKGYLAYRGPKPSEYFLLLATFDENKSLYMSPTVSVGNDLEGFVQSNVRWSVNGYSYGNMPTINTCINDNIIWHVMSLGSFLDVHTLVFDGNTFNEEGTNRDARSLVPGVAAALSMTPDNAGKWMLYSQSTTAQENGMYAFYTVTDCYGKTSNIQAEGGRIRDYYISAEEVLWDYAPLTRSPITGAKLQDPDVEESIFIRHDDMYIGHVYKKAVYKEYTDGTYTSVKPGNGDLLGPVIMAEVGDVVRVTFRNMATKRYSIHSHGIFTGQRASGVNYGSSVGAAPGETVKYLWQIPARSGPGPNDPNCIPWMYYSAVDTVKDVNSGLVGTVIVCRRGTLTLTSKRTDIDQEMFVYMSVSNENLSWYLEDNIRLFAPGRVGTDYRSDPEFEESNKMHAINGRVYGNNPNFVLEYGTKVAMYMMSLGAELDLHTMHLHGHTFVHTSEKHRDDVIQIFPGMAESVELIADNPGTWLIHCHVMDHIFAGMETTYTVLKPGVKKSVTF